MLITTSLGWPRSATAAMTWPARTRSAAFSSLTARRLDDDPALARGCQAVPHAGGFHGSSSSGGTARCSSRMRVPTCSYVPEPGREGTAAVMAVPDRLPGDVAPDPRPPRGRGDELDAG